MRTQSSIAISESITNVILMDSQLDHTTGLLTLREGSSGVSSISIHIAMIRMREIILL
ncbi:hypothetical protein J831_4100 [Acinetobacter baumannii 25691_8]|nr:hypothetical protein J831_4100 [Acinetobacter baumannii 25691_8]